MIQPYTQPNSFKQGERDILDHATGTPSTADAEILLGFRPGVVLRPDEQSLVVDGRPLSLEKTTDSIRAAISALAAGGVRESELIDRMTAAMPLPTLLPTGDFNRRTNPGEARTVAISKLMHYLRRFREIGILTYAVWTRNLALATAIPIRGNPPVERHRQHNDDELRIPANHLAFVAAPIVYTHLQRQHGPRGADEVASERGNNVSRTLPRGPSWVLESPLSSGKILVHDYRVHTLLGLLAQPQSVFTLYQAVPELPLDAIRAVVGLFQYYHFVQPSEEPVGNHAGNHAMPAAEVHSDDLATVDLKAKRISAADSEATAPQALSPQPASLPPAEPSPSSVSGNDLAVNDEEPAAKSTEDPGLDQWAFHDLLFHTDTRLPRRDRNYGKTYPFRTVRPALPAVKAPMSTHEVPLPVPNLEARKRQEATFSEVLERRRSIRRHGDTPLHKRELAEFLYRTARIRELKEPTVWPPRQYQHSYRPSPGGGAVHELEIYPIVHNCHGIAPGMYQYHPLHHCLYRICSANSLTDTMLEDANRATTNQGTPQVLLAISARFDRMTWAYESIVYATILKNVGALIQTMYLVATAMGLAPCAVGTGNAECFAQLTGLDVLRESSVGEFMLGSRPSS